ncbi:MAG: ATP-binding protein [Patescibacteria group bacterium]
MDDVLRYVQNQLTQAPFRLKPYTQDEQGIKYLQRQIYVKLQKYFDDFCLGMGEQGRWIIMPGLRGVGKTTVLAQLYTNKYVEIGQRRILYVSLNEVTDLLGSSLEEVLISYERILGTSFEKLESPVFIFIDEAQYDSKWAASLMSLYERSKKVFIICSGSSALELQTNPDVVRRSEIEKMYPASFCEFLMIKDRKLPTKGLKKNIKDALFNAGSAKDAYEKLLSYQQWVINTWSLIDRNYIDNYLRVGTLPFAINMSDEARVYKKIALLLDKVVNRDVMSLGKFDIKTLSDIKRTVYLLAEAEVKSIQDLARILGSNVNTVSNILEVLEKTELLIRVMPYGSNSKKVRKSSKYLFMSPAIRSSLMSVAGNDQIFQTQKGMLMEDVVALTLYREFVNGGNGSLNYDSRKKSADFILTNFRQNIIPIEIGLGMKEAGQVRNSMKKISASKYGVVICNSELQLLEEDNIVRVPLDYFLLI